jgi:hypothetical protein
MSQFQFTRTRIRERTPDCEPYTTLPVPQRDANKRQRSITLSDAGDDCHDDYPYSFNHKPSRALTVCKEPTQLERYNVWSDKRCKEDEEEKKEKEKRSCETRRIYRYTPDRGCHTDDEDAEEREFRLKVKATLSIPKPAPPQHHHHHHHHHHHNVAYIWPAEMCRRKENCVDEDWESRRRSSSCEKRITRKDNCRGDVEEKEKECGEESWSRYRRIKRTKTEEYTPLLGEEEVF